MWNVLLVKQCGDAPHMSTLCSVKGIQPVRSILRLQPVMCNLSCDCIIIYVHILCFTNNVEDKRSIHNAWDKNQAMSILLFKICHLAFSLS